MTSPITRVKKSRDNWKNKAVPRADEIRQLRKDKERSKQHVDKLRETNAEILVKLEEALKSNASLCVEISRARNDMNILRASTSANFLSSNLTQMNSYSQMRTLCVMLFIAGVLSFRSIPRSLGVFSELGWMPACQIPHFTSVINWTLRAGISIYKQVTTLDEPWLGIVDCSIDIGVRKALVALRVPLSVVQRKNGAIGLEDCECIGIKVSTIWNGELVNKELDEIFSKTGKPIAIIKDKGSDLEKGARLYSEQEHPRPILAIDDVGHVAANALKAQFSCDKKFIKFLKIVKTGSSRIRQTTLACLLPPKIRSKGRFQGITKVANWAQKILGIMTTDSADKDLGAKLKKAFRGLLKLKNFIEHFASTAMLVESFLKLMKQEALSEDSYAKAKIILEKFSQDSPLRLCLENWLSKHWNIHYLLGLGSKKMLVSDDVIESLFGKLKVVVQRNPKAELNRIVYTLPLLCGKHNPELISQAVLQCSHEAMLQFIEKNVPPTLRQKRAKILASLSSGVPETGKFPSTG